MGKYTQDQLDAYNDILEAGILATINRTISTYDPVTEVESVTGIATQSAAVVSFPASSGTIQAFDNRFIEDYKLGKVRFYYVAGYGLTYEPLPGDLLYFDSKVWEVAGATPLDPDGTTPTIYTMGVKESALSTIGGDPAVTGEAGSIQILELVTTRKTDIDSYYSEIGYDGESNPTLIERWEDATKVAKVFTKSIVWTDGNATKITTTDEKTGAVLVNDKTYDLDGNVLTESEVLTR